MFLKQSTSAVISFGPFVDEVDGVTLQIGLAGALDHATTGIKLSKNGAAMAVRAATVTASVYDSYGNYRVTLNATDTGTVGTLRAQFVDATTNLPVWADFYIVPANIYDSLFAAAGTDYLQVDATQFGGIAFTGANAAAYFNGDGYGTLLNAGGIEDVTTQTNYTLNWTGSGLVAGGVDLVGATIVLREGGRLTQRTIVTSTYVSASRLAVTVDSAPNWTITDAATYAIKDMAVPPNFRSLGINASGHLSRVTLVDSTTALAGSVAQVHNQEPVPARTAKLGSRADGVVKAFPALRIVPGEISQVWVDCTKQLTSNIQNVLNGLSSSGEFTVNIGMHGKYVSIVIDATQAEDLDTTTITIDVVPFVGQVLKLALDVLCDDD